MDTLEDHQFEGLLFCGQDRGTDSVLTQYPDGWRIRLHLNEASDAELLKLGHVCNSSCRSWNELSLSLP